MSGYLVIEHWLITIRVKCELTKNVLNIILHGT